VASLGRRGARTVATGLAIASIVGACVAQATPSPAPSLPGPSPSATSTPVPTFPPVTPRPTAAPVTPGIGWATASTSTELGGIARMLDGLIAIGTTDRGGVVWSSKHGVDWRVEDDSVTFDRVRPTFVAANDHASVIVGCALAACGTDGVWVSGTPWQRVAGSPFGRDEITQLVADDAGFLAIGPNVVTDQIEAWQSTDGRTWTKAVQPPSSVSSNANVFAGAGDRFLAAGQADGHAAAWTWHLGDQAWQISRIDPLTVFDTSEGDSVAVADGVFVVGGMLRTGSSDNFVPALWTSTDASTWTRVDLAEPADDVCEGSGIAIAAAGPDGIVASQGVGCGAFVITPSGGVSFSAGDPGDAVVDGPAGFEGYASRGLTRIGGVTPPSIRRSGAWPTTGRA